MAKDQKFGTFGGVFTPSILTILGVIMYLRLPWVVGNAGIYMAVAVVLVAHTISISTGLSVSSIATDKKVGAGGPYYIISRSFGLPIGGAIGVALFLGLSFSISLYIIGFSESFLQYIDVEPTKNAIRVCGTATIFAITIVTFISTSFAIKTQYVIMALIAGSLVSIALGSPTSDGPHLETAKGSPSFAVLFGIFFPAVTGFTAGVNMSGDLRDPKSAIPKGTMAAIGLGLLVYLGLVVYLGLRISPESLRDDPAVLQNMALWAPLVVAGIWGATLSSALGSILGAPRILQAMSADRITPKFFARGVGPTKEPRNALFLAFAIGEAGILIAELDIIARIVSMVFLAMYGSVNIAAAIESWASPDFRPTFRVPRVVSIIGAVTSVLLMIQLDIVAMLGSTALMLCLFLYLQRRQLNLESGDAWEGVWSSIVRMGLTRLSKSTGLQRNWRPNVLLFDEANHASHGPLKDFALSLVAGNGMVTDFALTAEATEPAPAPEPTEAAGLFEKQIVTKTPFASIRALSQHHGFSGLAPNTLLLPWRAHRGSGSEYLETLRTAAAAGLNLLAFEEARDHRDRDDRTSPRIDVWWFSDAGNLALSTALTRFLTSSPTWENAEVRFLIGGTGFEDDDELLRSRASRHLEDVRLTATLRVVPPPTGSRTRHAMVVEASRDASLVLVGFPSDLSGNGAGEQELLDSLEEIASLPSAVVLFRANAAFPDILALSPRKSVSGKERDATDTAIDLSKVVLPQHPELAAATELMLARMGELSSRWIERGVIKTYDQHQSLLERTRELVAARYDALIEASITTPTSRRRFIANPATTAFIESANGLLSELEAERLPGQCQGLREELEHQLEFSALLPRGLAPVLHIETPRSAFAADPDDSRALRRWKASRRRRWFYRRKLPQAISLRSLANYYEDERARGWLRTSLRQVERDSQELTIELARILANAEWRAHANFERTRYPDQVIAADSGDDDTVRAHLEAAKASNLAKLDELVAHLRERADQQCADIGRATAELGAQLSADLRRLDCDDFVRNTRRRKRAGSVIEKLGSELDGYQQRQAALLARAKIANGLAMVRHSLTVAVTQAVNDLNDGVRGSALRACSDLRRHLTNPTPAGLPATTPDPGDATFDPAPAMASFVRRIPTITSALPESASVLTDAAFAEIAHGEFIAPTTNDIEVRSGIQSLIESNLISRLEPDIARVTEVEAHAWMVVRDTARLVASQRDEASGANAGAGDDGDRLSSTLEYATERLDAETASIAELMASIQRTVESELEHLAALTGHLSLENALASAKPPRVQREQTRIAAIARAGAAKVRAVAASALYRRSTLRVGTEASSRSESIAGEVRTLVASGRGTAAASAKLPRYYRHLFLGQHNINEAFFHGRERELAQALAVLTQPEATEHRVVLISGDRGAGKTTLCQQLVTRLGAPAQWITPPPGGVASSMGFRAAFARSVGGRGTPAQLVAGLSDETVIVIDDLDMWWERRPGGLAAIDELLSLLRDAPRHTRFILAGGTHAVRLLDALRPLSRVALANVILEPLPAKVLRDIVLSRHTSTGLRFALRGRDESKTSEWGMARLFHAHFGHSAGNVGHALRSWVSHIDDVAEKTVHIRRPREEDWALLAKLRHEQIALLVAMLLHKSASADKLERVTAMGISDLLDALAELTKLGLLHRDRRRVYHLNSDIALPLTRWLAVEGRA